MPRHWQQVDHRGEEPKYQMCSEVNILYDGESGGRYLYGFIMQISNKGAGRTLKYEQDDSGVIDLST